MNRRCSEHVRCCKIGYHWEDCLVGFIWAWMRLYWLRSWVICFDWWHGMNSSCAALRWMLVNLFDSIPGCLCYLQISLFLNIRYCADLLFGYIVRGFLLTKARVLRPDYWWRWWIFGSQWWCQVPTIGPTQLCLLVIYCLKLFRLTRSTGNRVTPKSMSRREMAEAPVQTPAHSGASTPMGPVWAIILRQLKCLPHLLENHQPCKWDNICSFFKQVNDAMVAPPPPRWGFRESGDWQLTRTINQGHKL